MRAPAAAPPAAAPKPVPTGCATSASLGASRCPAAGTAVVLVRRLIAFMDGSRDSRAIGAPTSARMCPGRAQHAAHVARTVPGAHVKDSTMPASQRRFARSARLAHLMLATLDRGDTVLVPDPSYPIHIYGAVIAGADIRSVPLVPGVDFFAELEKAIRGSYPKPKMMVLGFPSNPTAQCVELEFFEKVVALARKHDIFVVHDLAYADIVFDGWKAPSIMQVPGAKDIAVEFFTLSKSYNMAGWRVGFMVGNADLVHALARIKSYHDYGSFTPVQVAAIAALEGEQQCVKDIAASYQRRRDVLVKGLREAGWDVECP